MNILFIVNHLNTGGITSYLLTLACGLKQKGHNVYLASSGGQLLENFSSVGITHFKVPLNTKSELSPKIIISFLKLRTEIKKFNIDLVHSNSRTTQVLGGLLSRSLAKPHIFTCHGFFKPRLLRKIFPCWGKMVIAISCQVQEHLVSDFKLARQKISVVNNGIDIKRFGNFFARDNTRKELGVGDIFLVGIIARLSDVKGHTYLIQAMQKVIENLPSAKLLIIGEGRMKNALLREVSDLGLGENVLFIEETKNTALALSAMDIFVMPSLQEGLGLALMEAMAQGLAVVGSAVGGIKTLIQDKTNGLLVSPGDVQGLAEAIIKLLHDHLLRQSLGANARRFITDNFSQEKMVDETEKVYKKCLEEKA